MASPDPTLLLLAAGLGTRFGALKQIDPVGPGSTALLDYALADASRAGFGRAVLVVREEIQGVMRAHLERTLAGRFPVTWVHQRMDDLPGGHHPPPNRRKPWGTAHAVWAARGHVEGPFAVANTDDYYGPEAYLALIEHFHTEPTTWAVVGYRLGDTLSAHGGVNRAPCRVDADGYLRDVVEVKGIDHRSTHLSLDDLVSTNLWGFTPSVFGLLEERLTAALDDPDRAPDAELLIPDLVRHCIARATCRVRVVRGGPDWFGMTFPEDRGRAAAMLRARGAPWPAPNAPTSSPPPAISLPARDPP